MTTSCPTSFVEPSRRGSAESARSRLRTRTCSFLFPSEPDTVPENTADVYSAEPYNQAHLFEGVTEEEKKSIVAQLNLIDARLPRGGLATYLESARKLLKDAQQDVNPLAGFTPHVPVGERLVGEHGPGTKAYGEFERLGMDQLPKTCFCLVAGGLGERLGFPGIKIGITADVTTGATFFEKFALFILAFQAHARKDTGDEDLQLPFVIMTSEDTHDRTVQFLDDNQFFGLDPEQVTIMQQQKVPAMMDPEARIAKTGSTVETKPHGHGDVHKLLHEHGLPKKWEAEGRRWLVLIQDTNPLAFRSMCAVLGVSASQDLAQNSVCTPRIPGEAVGSVVKLEKPDGSHKTINVEYHYLQSLLKSTPIGGDVADETGFSPYPGNINVLVFGIPCLARCLEATGGVVPEFVNPKWADAGRTKFKSATRLECMMQDFPLLCSPEDKIGFTQLDRCYCFTCCKNNINDAPHKRPHDCALTTEADIYGCGVRLLQLSGADVEIEEPDTKTFFDISVKLGARIVLQPSFCICLEELKTKLTGKIRISKRSSMVVEGDVVINGLDLDGALELSGNGEFKDQVVKNAGRPLEAIPEDELSTHPPSLQIRGYHCPIGEVEKVTVQP
mmetsp:Transcript_52536/g.104234  ORF Transcript_52536/g.104234 Transcript_52536/m.104234 type:complete len:615 (-) Transcript_52536:232-2076(-)